VGLPTKKTKIVCTIGPASWDQEILEELIRAGMNIARINFAHGDFEGHRRTIANVRAAAEAAGQRVAVFGDLPGPKMRIGALAEEPLMLERGQTLLLQTEEILGNQHRVSMDFTGLPGAVKPGDNIFMNDGYIQLVVDRVSGQEVHTTVRVGGELRSHKGVNFPGIDLGISALTERDKRLLTLAAEQALDGVGVSFVGGPWDITAVRKAAAALDYDPFVIAKIERASALENIDSILEGVDAIMVARGDLGVEIPIESIPATQKRLIHLANLAAKPVITATQMLESMTHNRRPTRAEATDVANAIWDGTDCVMLSGETAVGEYPVETVDTMRRIAEEAEPGLDRSNIAGELRQLQMRGDISRADRFSLAVDLTMETLQPDLAIILAESGGTARRVARFGLSQWIVAPSRLESTCQRLQFTRGVFPVNVSEKVPLASPESRRQYAQMWIQLHDSCSGLVLLVEGSGTLKAADTTRMDIIDLG
jgi:pyruvate kinase